MLRNRYLLLSSLLVIGVFIALYINVRSDTKIEMPHADDPKSSSTQELSPQNEPSNDNSIHTSQHSPLSKQHEKPTNQLPVAQPPITSNNSNTHNEQEPIQTEDQSLTKAEIDNVSETQINQLRSQCQTKSNQLLQKMIDEVKSNEEVTIKTLQAKFLGELMIAEAGCDSAFQAIYDDAASDYQEAGIPVSSMPAWKSQYQKEKAEVRASAIAQLAAAIK